MIGWHDLAASTRRLAEAQGANTVLTDSREMTAELIYYLRDTSLPVTISFRKETPHNHFEMTLPFTKATPEPVLYVTLIRTNSVRKRFDWRKSLAIRSFRPMPLRCARHASFCSRAMMAIMLSDQAPFKLASIAALVGVAAALVFVGWPDIDLAAARLFYVEPRHFLFNHSELATTLRWGFRALTWGRPSPR